MSLPVNTAAKLLAGEVNKDRLRNNTKPLGKPIKPADLGIWATDLWEQIIPDLERRQVVSFIDTPALTELCNWYQLYKDLCDYVPNLIDSASAQRIATQKKVAWEQCLKLFKEFGMTPISRNLINAESVDDDDLSELEQGG